MRITNCISTILSDDRLHRFAYDHQLACKVTLVALAAIAVATACFISAALLLATLKIFPFVIPHKHDMTTHTFKEESFSIEGATASLKYEGHVPVMTINADTSYKAGYVHGHLLGHEIKKMVDSLNFAIWYAFRSPDPKLIEEMKKEIPPVYLQEMKGVIDGFKEKTGKTLCLNKYILLHYYPDRPHFRARPGKDRLPLIVPACTTIMGRDPEKGITFGRNLDWPSFDVAGACSLCIKRKTRNGTTTFEMGFAGFVGTVSGMNSHGVTLAMNACRGRTIGVKGLPAVFLNRICLERAKRVTAIPKLLKMHPPLGPYHLAVADKINAQTFHLHQHTEGGHHIRRLAESKPLLTTNRSRSIPAGLHTHFFRSESREKIIREQFVTIREALQLPTVNFLLTTHHLMMYPRDQVIELVFSNAFAADGALQRLDKKQLFE